MKVYFFTLSVASWLSKFIEILVVVVAVKAIEQEFLWWHVWVRAQLGSRDDGACTKNTDNIYHKNDRRKGSKALPQHLKSEKNR